MAEAFTLKYTKEEKKAAKSSKHSKTYIRVQAVISSHVALKQYGQENIWFSELMTGVVGNNILGSSGAVNSRLLTLSNKEARKTGNGLAAALLGSTSSELGVEEWILTSKAMQELDRNIIWFRPMMNRIAMRLLADVAWGAKLRLYTGAALSIMDMITDVMAVRRFWLLGNYGYAYANIGFIAASLFIQLILVYGQNRKKGMKAITYEAMVVLLLIKPAVDCHRVANGDVQEENSLVDYQMELTFTKVCEMFCESIPSSVLQTFALLESGDASEQVVASIVVSASCIAFVSSTISQDFDTHPAKRLGSPNFYGYMKDKNRLQVFILMTLMTTAHVLMKILACSLMLQISQVWFVLYMAGDMFLYFCYKIIRGDLQYYLKLGNILSCVVSVINRAIVKIVVDFRLLIQFRHPQELGGLYWSVNVCINQAFCFLSVYLYGHYSKEVSEEVAELLWKLVAGLFLFSMLNFGLFLKSINENFLKTFYSPITGKQFVVITYFEEAETDSERFKIFGKHRSYYYSIQSELMKWLNDNWEKWEEEKPEVFTAKNIVKIPADMLPIKYLKSIGGLEGRRMSLDKLIREEEEEDKAKRESLKEDVLVAP